MEPEAHNFDRRGTDANIAALSVRMSGVEGRVEVLEQKQEVANLELRANTELTRQMHSKVEEIHEVFIAAKSGFKLLEGAGKLAKPLLWLVILVGAVWGYFTTGHWNLP